MKQCRIKKINMSEITQNRKDRYDMYLFLCEWLLLILWKVCYNFNNNREWVYIKWQQYRGRYPYEGTDIGRLNGELNGREGKKQDKGMNSWTRIIWRDVLKPKTVEAL